MSSPEQVSPERTGCRIVIAGTGGQGVITSARLLTEFFVSRGHQVLSSQLHGMAQRGGAVQSLVTVDSGISPVLGRCGADFVLGLEPVETVRALPFITSRTVVFMNPIPVFPFILAQNFVLEDGPTEYPRVSQLFESIRAVTAHLVTVDATALAKEAGAIQTLNVVLLGCLFGSGLLPYAAQDFLDSTMKTVPPQLAELNQRAFHSGVVYGEALDQIEIKSCL